MIMRTIILRAVVCGLLLLPVVASSLHGQVSDKGCVNAARIIANGHPAGEADWAFGAISGCGTDGARALAAGIAAYADETDVQVLDRFMTNVDNWRDAAIFDAAIRLATNSAATPQARSFAVRHLIVLLQPYHLFSYAGLTQGADTISTKEMDIFISGCNARMTSARHGSLAGSPLPSDFENRIRATLALLANNPSTPTPVRNAARCLPPPR